MNEKATVSKELNEKHRKILEGLLKLPENKECADCKSKGPRWASVNLGVFLCMQCSGIHRSLGVHISKVRSAALDTWLPEQVAFIQTMGNQKANSYWESELPPNYDRVGIENFIRAKYEEKRWVPRDKRFTIPSKQQETMTGHADEHENSSNHKVSEKDNTPIKKDNLVVPKLPSPVSYTSNVETGTAQVYPPEVAPTVVNATPPPKANSTSDLLDMLSLDGPNEIGEESSPVDDNSWANFQSAELTSPLDNKSTTESAENKSNIKSEVEDLFKDLVSVSQPSTQTKTQTVVKNETTSGAEDLFNVSKSLFEPPLQTNSQTNANTETKSIVEDLFKDPTSSLQPSAEKKTQPDVKNEIMSLFDKSNMVSPFALHQQQLAFLAHQQAHAMAANKPDNSPSTLSSFGTHQLNTSDSNSMKGNIAAQSWGNFTYQLPGNVPFGQMGNVSHTLSENAGHVRASSLSALELSRSTDGVNTVHAASSSSMSSGRSSDDYNFSSLTEGMFSKR
ncbi:ADP-ribosylation factor GTPase-activating protein AGD5-like [Curcuma longa]|uniref:ADP-ribosylation factor GTPase-activating protein AGD5-like n=1 Tax=Curcuma longa TaxID=136217 RepID=UPI003D9E4D0F